MAGTIEGVTGKLRGAGMGVRVEGVDVEEKVGNASRADELGNTPRPADKVRSRLRQV